MFLEYILANFLEQQIEEYHGKAQTRPKIHQEMDLEAHASKVKNLSDQTSKIGQKVVKTHLDLEQNALKNL